MPQMGCVLIFAFQHLTAVIDTSMLSLKIKYCQIINFERKAWSNMRKNVATVMFG